MTTSTVQQSPASQSEIDDQHLHIRYQIFVVLWVIATIFHMIKNRVLDNNLGLLTLAITSVFVLAKPQSVSRFFLFLIIQLAVVIVDIPGLSNHWIFTTFVNITILQVMFYLVLKRRNFVINKGELIKTFAPIVRIEVLILYFFVVFHKLNIDFFDGGISCATDLLNGTRGLEFLPIPESWLVFNSYFTVIIEALIPLMLWFRKTRNLGIVVGLVFHNIIAYNIYNGFYDFSSMIFALYFLFSDNQFSSKIYSLYNKLASIKKPVKEDLKKYNYANFFILLAMAGLLLLGFAVAYGFSQSRYIQDYVLVPWTLYSFPFIIIFILSMKKWSYSGLRKPFSLAHMSLIILPIIVFLNGMSPYLGLKTEYSFSMFSNLRTEGRVSNHFIMPAGFQIFNYQDDLVEIISTSEYGLNENIEREELITFFELRDRVSVFRPEFVEYIYKGEHHYYNANEPDYAGLQERHPIILRKLMRFRPVNKSGIQTCAH